MTNKERKKKKKRKKEKKKERRNPPAARKISALLNRADYPKFKSRKAEQATERPHSFCHFERSEESLFLFLAQIAERFPASLGRQNNLFIRCPVSRRPT
jgi:hypothetical protein